MIIYSDTLDGLTPDRIRGFFVGWPHPLTPKTHLKLLRGSTHFILAIDDTSGAVVGYITALSDGFHAAFIPNLEVLPAYQGQGIGTALMQGMLEKLNDHYAIDLMCDASMQPFYERLGLRRSVGMVVRNFDRQSGA